MCLIPRRWRNNVFPPPTWDQVVGLVTHTCKPAITIYLRQPARSPRRRRVRRDEVLLRPARREICIPICICRGRHHVVRRHRERRGCAAGGPRQRQWGRRNRSSEYRRWTVGRAIRKCGQWGHAVHDRRVMLSTYLMDMDSTRRWVLLGHGQHPTTSFRAGTSRGHRCRNSERFVGKDGVALRDAVEEERIVDVILVCRRPWRQNYNSEINDDESHKVENGSPLRSRGHMISDVGGKNCLAELKMGNESSTLARRVIPPAKKIERAARTMNNINQNSRYESATHLWPFGRYPRALRSADAERGPRTIHRNAAAIMNTIKFPHDTVSSGARIQQLWSWTNNSAASTTEICRTARGLRTTPSRC